MSDAKYILVDDSTIKILPGGGGKVLRPSPTEDVLFKMTGSEVDGSFDYFEMKVGYLDGTAVHIHLNQHETFHIIEGELTVKVGEETIEAKAGDFLHIPPGVPHAYVNLNQEVETRAVGTVVPGGLYAFLEEFLNYIETASPPDPAKIQEMSAQHGQAYVGPPLAVQMGLRETH